jgi:hypothetical protein
VPDDGPPNWGELDEPEHDEGPVSLSELRSDEDLLSALGRGEESSRAAGSSPDSDDLALLLRDWRASIDSEPLPELVDTDLAMATLAGAEQRAKLQRKRPVLMPVAGAAAGLVVALGALAGVARSAQPGGALWGVSKVLYADHARSVMATDFVRQHLQAARAAMRTGHHQRALGDMTAISQHLPAVHDGTAKDSLIAAWRKLEDELNMTPPRPVAPAPRQHAEAIQPVPTRSTSEPTRSTTRSTTKKSPTGPTTTTTPAQSLGHSGGSGGAQSPGHSGGSGGAQSPGHPGGSGGAQSTQPGGSPSPTTEPSTQPGGSPSPTTEPSTQPGGSPSPTTEPSTQSGGSPSPTTEPSTQSGGSSTEPTESVPPDGSPTQGQSANPTR